MFVMMSMPPAAAAWCGAMFGRAVALPENRWFLGGAIRVLLRLSLNAGQIVLLLKMLTGLRTFFTDFEVRDFLVVGRRSSDLAYPVSTHTHNM